MTEPPPTAPTEHPPTTTETGEQPTAGEPTAATDDADTSAIQTAAAKAAVVTRRDYLTVLLSVLDPKLRFPKDSTFDDVWAVYKPSLYAQLLDSEQWRHCYAEEFDFEPAPHERELMPGDCEPERQMMSLREMLLQLILAKYRGGQLDERIQLDDRMWFGERIDIEMPVADVVELDNPVYWKRVALAKCKNHLLLMQCKLLPKYDWKRLAITSKLIELIENTPQMEWKEEKMNATFAAAAPYVTELEVGQLLSIDPVFLETNAYDKSYQIFNIPPKDCHHGNLGAAVGELFNLTRLQITFGLREMGFQYEKRHLDMSYRDIQRLSDGLARLQRLEELAIVDSILDDRKCKILVRGLLNCPLRRLDLRNCQLGNDAAKAIAYLLMHNVHASLSELELRSNRIGPPGWQAIGYGIQHYAGELEYLGAGNNPVGEEGVVAIGGAILDAPQVWRLDLARADVAGDGPLRLMQIVGFHRRLRWLDVSSMCWGRKLGDRLIHAVLQHWELEHLAVWNCGFTDEQESKLRILIERNVFYRENPCMRRDVITPEDAAVIDEWAVQIKNPILLRVLAANPPIDPAVDSGPTPVFPFPRVPRFVPRRQRRIRCNSELLDVSYIDCFGADADMQAYDPYRHTDRTEEGYSPSDEEDFAFEPNEFTAEEFANSVVMGTHVRLNDRQYFAEGPVDGKEAQL